MTKDERKDAIQVLKDIWLVDSTKDHAWILPAGREYLEKLQKVQEEEINKDIHDDLDYALLKYLYNKEEVTTIDNLKGVQAKHRLWDGICTKAF